MKSEKPKPAETREEMWARLSALAGRDPEGNILPPDPQVKIDRTPVTWWKNPHDR